MPISIISLVAAFPWEHEIEISDLVYKLQGNRNENSKHHQRML